MAAGTGALQQGGMMSVFNVSWNSGGDPGRTYRNAQKAREALSAAYSGAAELQKDFTPEVEQAFSLLENFFGEIQKEANMARGIED